MHSTFDTIVYRNTIGMCVSKHLAKSSRSLALSLCLKKKECRATRKEVLKQNDAANTKIFYPKENEQYVWYENGGMGKKPTKLLQKLAVESTASETNVHCVSKLLHIVQNIMKAPMIRNTMQMI